MKEVTIKVDERWFEILGLLSQNTEGFVWIDVKDTDE